MTCADGLRSLQEVHDDEEMTVSGAGAMNGPSGNEGEEEEEFIDEQVEETIMYVVSMFSFCNLLQDMKSHMKHEV